MRVAFLAVCLILAGCQTTVSPGGGTVVTPPVTNTGSVISAAQQYAATACRFLPQASSIVELLNLGLPGLSTATAIGKAICDAYIQAGSVRALGASRTPLPRVGGVLIMGTKV